MTLETLSEVTLFIGTPWLFYLAKVMWERGKISREKYVQLGQRLSKHFS